MELIEASYYDFMDNMRRRMTRGFHHKMANMISNSTIKFTPMDDELQVGIFFLLKNLRLYEN